MNLEVCGSGKDCLPRCRVFTSRLTVYFVMESVSWYSVSLPSMPRARRMAK